MDEDKDESSSGHDGDREDTADRQEDTAPVHQPQWMESPLFKMLSCLATGNTEANVEGLDVESVSSTSSSSSPSLSSSSMVTNDSSTDSNNRDPCIIWVEPLMSCRIVENGLIPEARRAVSKSARPPNMGYLRRGGIRKVSHGPSRVSSQHPQQRNDSLKKIPSSPGGRGDVRQSTEDSNDDGRKASPITAVQGWNSSLEYTLSEALPGSAVGEDASTTGLALKSTSNTSSSQTQDEHIAHCAVDSQNNNHPGVRDEKPRESAKTELVKLCPGKHDSILEGQGDTGKGNDNDRLSLAVHPETPAGYSGKAPLQVRMVGGSNATSSNGISLTRKRSTPVDNLPQTRQEPKQAPQCKSIGTSTGGQLYPFARGTFQSWRPYSNDSDPECLDNVSKTAWSSHVTREQRFKCGLQTRARLEQIQQQQNALRKCTNRTSQITRLAEVTTDQLPDILSTPVIRSYDFPYRPYKTASSDTDIRPDNSAPSSPTTKSKNKRHVLTLTEIKKALDIALKNLALLDETEQPDDSDTNAIEEIQTFPYSRHEAIGQSSLKEDSPTVAERLGGHERVGKKDATVQINFNQDCHDDQFSDDVPSSEDSLHSVKDDSTIIIDDRGMGPMLKVTDEKPSGIKTRLVSEAPVHLDFDTRAASSGDSNASLPGTPSNTSRDSDFSARRNSTSTYPIGPYPPTKTSTTPRERSPKYDAVCASAKCDKKEEFVKDNTSDIEEYSKSHADDTFATGSPTIQDSEDSNETTSSIHENNSTTNIQKDSAPISDVNCFGANEDFAVRLKTERGEGDGKPSLLGIVQNDNDERGNCPSKLDKLDQDLLNANGTSLGGAEDSNVGVSRALNERRSRKNDPGVCRECCTARKIASECQLQRWQFQCPRSLGRHIAVSDTHLVTKQNPRNHSLDTGIHLFSGGDGDESNPGTSGDDKKVETHGEMTISSDAPLEQSGRENATHDGNGDQKDQEKASTKTIKQRLRSFIRTCFKRK